LDRGRRGQRVDRGRESRAAVRRRPPALARPRPRATRRAAHVPWRDRLRSGRARPHPPPAPRALRLGRPLDRSRRRHARVARGPPGRHMSDLVWYFAYGSNMQPATFTGRRGITAARAVAARLAGWRLVFDKPPLLPVGHGMANVVEEAGAEVFGVAYA